MSPFKGDAMNRVTPFGALLLAAGVLLTGGPAMQAQTQCSTEHLKCLQICAKNDPRGTSGCNAGCDAAYSACINNIPPRPLSLVTLHSGCDSVSKSRDGACVAAMHRVCSLSTGRGGGVSQEVGGDVFGVSCFTPSWYGDVPLSALTAQHMWCNDLSKGQTPQCMAAVRRWCLASGKGAAGIVQEVGNGVFGVACFTPGASQEVPLTALTAQHSGCNDLAKSQEPDCMAAVHRWCTANGKGNTGISQEVGTSGLWVSCVGAPWYGNVAVH